MNKKFQILITENCVYYVFFWVNQIKKMSYKLAIANVNKICLTKNNYLLNVMFRGTPCTFMFNKLFYLS